MALTPKSHFIPKCSEGVDIVVGDESVIVVGDDLRGVGVASHDGRGVHGGSLTYDERRIVIHRREEQQVSTHVDLTNQVAVGDASQERHFVLMIVGMAGQSHACGHGDEFLASVAVADEHSVIRSLRDLTQGLDDEPQILLPDMLAHEEEHRLIVVDVQHLRKDCGHAPRRTSPLPMYAETSDQEMACHIYKADG